MEEVIVRELVAGFQKIYTTALVQVILYGSVARNTSEKESDIDIAVIINTDNPKEYEDELLDFVVEMNLKYDKVFSIIDIELDVYKKWKNVLPFFKNVGKDGVILWKAA
jgi:Nucleotidyltransferase domain.